MSEVIAIALGALVGLSLGALGGGGSTLAVPILVFVAGIEPQVATTASLLVVGVASAFGAFEHHKQDNVRFGAGLAFGAAGIVGSRVGTSINESLDPTALLMAFSGLILFVAVRMLRSSTVPRSTAPTIATPGSDLHGGETGITLVRSKTSTGIDLSLRSLAKLALAATLVGVLTGLFGVGGGFAVVPALTLLLGFDTKSAIGTSLVVITVNASVALTMRSNLTEVPWPVILPFLLLVTAGVVVGSRLAGRFDGRTLTRSFALMLIVVAVYTAASSFTL